MVRRQLIKINAPTGKPNITCRAVVNKGALLLPNNDTSFDHRQYNTTRGAPGRISGSKATHSSRTFSPIKNPPTNMLQEGYLASSGSRFLDIDGNDPIGLTEQPTDLDPKDTSYKIQRHLSLFDLTRPAAVHKVNKITVDRKTDEKHERIPRNTSKLLPNAKERPSLPRRERPLQRMGTKNQPYVVPKFMPSFKEMMVERKRREPMISITESTPPSLQKWAVEWNSEPKSFSISELKEDILRETAENESFGEPFDPEKRTTEVERYIVEKRKPRDSSKINTLPEPFVPPWSHVQLTLDDPKKKTRASSGWFPLKLDRLEDSYNGFFAKKYSFQRAINVNDDETDTGKEPSSRVPQIFSERKFVYDEDEQEFYEWFKQKISKASKERNIEFQPNSQDVVSRTEAKVDSSVSNNDAINNDGITNTSVSSNMNSNANMSTLALLNRGRKDEFQTSNRKAANQGPEEKSSFIQWLNSRGYTLPNRTGIAGVTSEGSEVEKPGVPIYPWSSPYSRNFAKEEVTGDTTEDQDVPGGSKKETGKTPHGLSLRTNVTKSRMSFRGSNKTKLHEGVHRRNHVGKNLVNKSSMKEVYRRNSFKKKTLPYSQWAVNNEIDHIRNLRRLESKIPETNNLSAELSEKKNHSILPYGFSQTNKANSSKDVHTSKTKAHIDVVTKRLADEVQKARASSKLDIETWESKVPFEGNNFYSITEDSGPLTHIDFRKLLTTNDEEDSKEDTGNEYFSDTGNDELSKPSELQNQPWSAFSKEPAEIDVRSNDSTNRSNRLDSTDNELYEDANEHVVNRLELDQEEDEDWHTSQRDSWPNDIGFLKVLARKTANPGFTVTLPK